MKYFYTLLFLIGANFFIIKNATAQDIHYSQFYNAPLNVNPGKTGIFNGDKRFMISVRDQWRSVPVPWLTFTGSYDQKIYPKKSEKYFLAWGVTFNYDRSGLANFSLGNLNLLGSYTRILNKNNLLTLGLGLGYATRGLDQDRLTWDTQWDGLAFNGNVGSGEANIEGVSFIENMIGLNYRWQKTSRTKVDLGLGMYHPIEPNVSHLGDDLTLAKRLAATAIASFEIIDPLDIQVHGIAQFQGEYREYQIGALGKIYVDKKRGKEFELHLGLGYRFTGALFPSIAIQYRNIYASFSYDIDFADSQSKTNHRGGPELHFNYIITNVKPLKKFKVCPIF